MSIKEFDQNTTISNPDLPANALSSKQFNTIVDVVSEGEIAGFATPHKRGIASNDDAYKTACKTDIFLNKTPILNVASNLTDAEFLAKVQSPSDTDFNFKNVGFDFRLGTSSQSFISGIKNIENETPKGTPVTTGSPVTHTVNSATINAVRVTIRFSSLQKFEDNGDINGTEVKLKIKTIESNGTTTTAIDDTVKGRSTNAYLRDYQIDFSSTTAYPVQVRVERITADSTESQLVNAFSFHSITELTFEQNAYPNTAHTALRIGAEQFPRVPSRVFRLRGIKVKIPNNATVDLQTGALSYSGTWNGTFATNKAWTTDPAWILYDILYNERYGCSIPESKLNKFTFKTVSEYCGESVDDGEGGTEPRFSLNINITQQQAAFDLINDLCSVMRVMPFYEAGSISINQDAPSEPIFAFNNSSVTKEGFSYTGSSLKTRHTVINVNYFDLETQDIDVETVEADAATQAKYGVVTKNINAFATTSRGQASRFGKWFLYNEQNSGESVVFTTTIDAGVSVRCGDVIEISDSLKAGVRRGGRIKSASGTTITLDDFQNTDIPNVNTSPTLTCMLPDNTLEQKNIASFSNNVVTLSQAFSTDPNDNAVYIIETPTLQTTTWRVISVKDEEDSTYTITALSHNSGKYDFVEDNVPLPVRSFSTLTEIKQGPSGLKAEEFVIQINDKPVTQIILDWENVKGASKYRVYYRFENGDFAQLETTSSNLEILNTKKGKYEFEVFTYNALNEPSPNPSILEFDATGKTTIVDNIQNLTIEPITEDLVRLRFARTTNTNILNGGHIFIRHTLLTGTSATFTAAQDIIESISGASTEVIVPSLEGTYILKYRDANGRFSATPTKIALSQILTADSIVVKTDREDLDTPPFNNTTSSLFTNTQYSSARGGLILTNPVNNSTGTYDFKDTLDLGGTFSLTLKRHFTGTGFYTGDQFDNRTEFIDTWTSFDGDEAPDANASIAVRTTTDNPSGSPTYGDFNAFANGTFKGRGFQFRVTLSTADTAQNMNLQQLGYTAILKTRTEQSAVIFSDSAGDGTGSAVAKAVVFSSPFFVGTSALGNLNNFLPAVNISAQNMASGDYFELTNISGTGFTVHFKNSSNASIIRKFTFSAVGFGKGG